MADLKKHSSAGEEAITLVKHLLGSQLWDGWFSRFPEDLPDDQVLPRQALTFVSLALDKIKMSKADSEAAKKPALKAFEEYTENVKRRRTAA